MRTPNVPLLKQTLQYIEDHPEDWDQSQWHCGTSCCFAGRAAVLDGAEWSRGGWFIDPARSSTVVARDDDPVEDVLTQGALRYVPVERRAARILGLPFDRAMELFSACNTLDDLREIVAELTGGTS